MPLKRVALEVADEVTPDTAAIGAANTRGHAGHRGGRVSIAGSISDRGAEPGREPTIPRPGWLATNTDVVGIEQALRAVGVTAVERAVVVGAGGTAQAALAALRGLGEYRTDGARPRPARAGALRDTAERLGVAPRIVGGFPSTPLPPADVVISTVPAGAADALAGRRLGPRDGAPRRHLRAVADRPGAPRPRRGCRVAGGLEVLLHQAVGQVELMTGLPGPTEAMAAALAAAAGDRRP